MITKHELDERDDRPAKKRKTDWDSPLTPLDSSPVRQNLKPLPPHILLLSLPNLLLLPPNHHFHAESLRLSLTALQKCIALESLAPDIECRAWIGLAEVGMKVIAGGLSQPSGPPWAKGVEKEVEKAISKGVLLAQKHPSLRAYRHQFIITHAQLSLWQQNSKFARGLLKRLTTSFFPSDPPQALYHTYLAIINHHSSLEETYPTLSTIEDLRTLATKNKHQHVALLAHVLRLRGLVAAGMWKEVLSASRIAEQALGLSYEPTTAPTNPPSAADDATFLDFDDPFECTMALHTLIIGIVYYTHMGASAESSPRLSHLHALLDAGALTKMPEGVVPLYFSTGPPLFVQVTHPRILFLLGFLVSSASKRDAVGRKPKRKVFAMEGLATLEKESKKEISYPPWATLGDAEEIELRQARIKADLLCELAAISIMRSEFDLAEESLANVISHTRTHSIFDLFSARITLHHAHLAHSLGQTTRALHYYKVTAHLADSGSFVQVSAKLGQLALMIGLRTRRMTEPKARSSSAAAEETSVENELDPDEELLQELGAQVTKACRGMGGTLEACGKVIEACLSGEILKAKQHLKESLNKASNSQDNYLRALIMALISSHYFHIAADHAEKMLGTCEALAAGLGAPASKQEAAQASVGNAVLGLWVGERFLELHKRAGKDDKVVKQTKKNERLRGVVEDIRTRQDVVSPVVAVAVAQ